MWSSQGDLLIDGGYLNNMPVDVMHAMGELPAPAHRPCYCAFMMWGSPPLQRLLCSTCCNLLITGPQTMQRCLLRPTHTLSGQILSA